MIYKGIYVNKAQLIDSVAAEMDLPKNVVTQAVETLLDKIMQTLAKGEDVILADFGTLSISKRAARTGRNPKTGDPIAIPASRVVTFKARKGLKDAVNSVELAT